MKTTIPKITKDRPLGGTLIYWSKRIFKRDKFKCAYCGWNGRRWPRCCFLTADHLLPKGHPERRNEEYIVTACSWCNVLENRWLENKTLKLRFDGMSRQQLIAQRKPLIEKRSRDYQEWFKQNCGHREAT